MFIIIYIHDEKQLRPFGTGKSTDADGLSAIFPKLSAWVIVHVLTKFYNSINQS